MAPALYPSPAGKSILCAIRKIRDAVPRLSLSFLPLPASFPAFHFPAFLRALSHFRTTSTVSGAANSTTAATHATTPSVTARGYHDATFSIIGVSRSFSSA